MISRDPGQVSETAMRLHRAHPEVVLGGVEAGRVVVADSPLRPRDHHGRNIVAPKIRSGYAGSEWCRRRRRGGAMFSAGGSRRRPLMLR